MRWQIRRWPQIVAVARDEAVKSIFMVKPLPRNLASDSERHGVLLIWGSLVALFVFWL